MGFTESGSQIGDKFLYALQCRFQIQYVWTLSKLFMKHSLYSFVKKKVALTRNKHYKIDLQKAESTDKPNEDEYKPMYHQKFLIGNTLCMSIHDMEQIIWHTYVALTLCFMEISGYL